MIPIRCLTSDGIVLSTARSVIWTRLNTILQSARGSAIDRILSSMLHFIRTKTLRREAFMPILYLTISFTVPLDIAIQIMGSTIRRTCRTIPMLGRPASIRGFIIDYFAHLVVTRRLKAHHLIPVPYQNDLAMYGNDVMDFTSSGLRLM